MTWTCPRCKRNKFTKRYQPHNCNGCFRKRGFEPGGLKRTEKTAILAEIIAFYIVGMTEGKAESVAK